MQILLSLGDILARFSSLPMDSYQRDWDLHLTGEPKEFDRERCKNLTEKDAWCLFPGVPRPIREAVSEDAKLRSFVSPVPHQDIGFSTQLVAHTAGRLLDYRFRVFLSGEHPFDRC